MRASGLIEHAPLVIRLGAGERGYALELRWGGAERAAAADAVLSGSYAAMYQAAMACVVGWQDVLDEHGRALPFTVETDGRRVRLLERLMGALTAREQGDAVAAVLAAIGLSEAAPLVAASSGAQVETGPTPPPDAPGR